MKCFVCKETFEEPKISYFGKDRFAIAYCPICTACLPRCDAQSPTAGEISEAMVERAAKAYRENLRGKTIDDHRRAMRAALSAVSLTRLPDAGWRPTHRHKKTGSEYMLLGIGKMQTGKWTEPWYDEDCQPHAGSSIDMREVAIYRSIKDGSLWARPREEFENGRFEALSDALPDTGRE